MRHRKSISQTCIAVAVLAVTHTSAAYGLGARPVTPAPAPPAQGACPMNYFLVTPAAGSAVTPFCVSKYEMKKVSGKAVSQAALSPWTELTRDEAVAACRAIADDADLISNAQWQEIAHQVAATGANWSGGAAGSGSLSVGAANLNLAGGMPAAASDSLACSGVDQECSNTVWHLNRRTLRVGNDTIWDFAGNVSEWVMEDAPRLGFTGSAGELWIRNNADLHGNFGTKADFTNAPWLSDLHLGHLFFTWDGGAIAKGGAYVDNLEVAGPYYTDGTLRIDHVLPFVGFRCITAVRESSTKVNKKHVRKPWKFLRILLKKRLHCPAYRNDPRVYHNWLRNLQELQRRSHRR